MKINIKNSITTMNESEFLEAVEKSKTTMSTKSGSVYFDLYKNHEGVYVVFFEFRNNLGVVFSFNTELSRKYFFQKFQSSKLINGKYLYIGTHDGYEAFYISYRKEDKTIYFENLYHLRYEGEDFEDLELKKEFQFTIQEDALGHYINCFKNLEI